jgi:hypothetical protein
MTFYFPFKNRKITLHRIFLHCWAFFWNIWGFWFSSYIVGTLLHRLTLINFYYVAKNGLTFFTQFTLGILSSFVVSIVWDSYHIASFKSIFIVVALSRRSSQVGLYLFWFLDNLFDIPFSLKSCGQVGVCWGFISDHHQMKVAEQPRGDLQWSLFKHVMPGIP